MVMMSHRHLPVNNFVSEIVCDLNRRGTDINYFSHHQNHFQYEITVRHQGGTATLAGRRAVRRVDCPGGSPQRER